jgi:RNA polymerase sigma factor (TIGR02999 family)
VRLAAMAQMRRILVDYARARNARKRPGAQVRVEQQDVADVQHSQRIDLLAIDQALTHRAAADPRASRVVELRFLGGLMETETAEVLGISMATVKRDWVFARPCATEVHRRLRMGKSRLRWRCRARALVLG